VCVMMELSGLGGCVHGASGRCSGVDLFCSLSKRVVTIGMTSCGFDCSIFVFGFVKVVTLSWSLALVCNPAFTFRLLCYCLGLLSKLLFFVSNFV
jgi:hypothetical protein